MGPKNIQIRVNIPKLENCVALAQIWYAHSKCFLVLNLKVVSTSDKEEKRKRDEEIKRRKANSTAKWHRFLTEDNIETDVYKQQFMEFSPISAFTGQWFLSPLFSPKTCTSKLQSIQCAFTLCCPLWWCNKLVMSSVSHQLHCLCHTVLKWVNNTI